MNEDVKDKINKLIDSIDDENVLQLIMEDVTYYASNKDVIDELNKDQLKELNDAITEVDNNQTISWNDLKNEMTEWKKR